MRLLHALCGVERSVNDLAAEAGASASSVSQHLAKLRQGHLVVTRLDGHRVHYSLVNDHVQHLVLEALSEADHLVGGGTHHEPSDRP